MLLAGSTRFLSLEVSRGRQARRHTPTHAMAPTRTVCIRQSCLACLPRRCSNSVGFAHGQPRSQGAAAPQAADAARSQNTEGRPVARPASQRVTTPTRAHTSPQAAVPRPKRPVSSGPLWSFSKACSSQGRTQGARALPASSGRKHTHTPPRQALPSQQPSGRKVGQQSKQARTRACPAHRARPLLNRWLPTHSFPQRVAARTYSTSPAQAHALVGCTASHRPRHTNERPRAQAVRTIPAEAGSARQRIGVSFPCDQAQGHAPAPIQHRVGHHAHGPSTVMLNSRLGRIGTCVWDALTPTVRRQDRKHPLAKTPVRTHLVPQTAG